MMLDTRLTIPDENSGSGNKALRSFGWPELTARINAARDLRQFLIADTLMFAASFDDVAAGYFARGEQGKPHVNHSALGGGKCSDGMGVFGEARAVTGDREK